LRQGVTQPVTLQKTHALAGGALLTRFIPLWKRAFMSRSGK
jgi:hypothetical protein